jgi:hypothetical protein
MNSISRSQSGLAWRSRLPLLGLFDFVDQVVGHLEQSFRCAPIRHRVGTGPAGQERLKYDLASAWPGFS